MLAYDKQQLLILLNNSLNYQRTHLHSTHKHRKLPILNSLKKIGYKRFGF